LATFSTPATLLVSFTHKKPGIEYSFVLSVGRYAPAKTTESLIGK